ncbi:ribonuclease [Kluyveromyces lactis]|uniref:Endonuclease n=1 Tax=Kluyveromyces lactis (strain ATCC 8585 / CBS 2359 / DSM 70799 / NBRC 1267 / NRRL Y-1140 / WM37) TaxID=284590 RepID=Q6CSJ8_KLULA|nr:uncharacterized protein KLLA0_D00440g [Kluyveromyces lactis]CAH00187.1 KLLA0D00440p [Kluyveromyces lactis]|eukprot:XP_453091.1 uncharacterized protein KLLA0_D00440g [Kluyveromyces lactis]
MSFSRNAFSALVGVGTVSYFWGKSSALSGGNSGTSFPGSTGSSNNIPSDPSSSNQAGRVSLVGSNVDPGAFFKYGFPGPIHDLETRQEFISCYDRRTRNPYWVLEHITPESLKTKGADRKNSIFKEDEQIPEMFRGRLKDYFRSGYDRGHQAPAANAKFSQQAMDDTFYLTNMCPQVGEGFNRDYWAHLEYFCRQLVDKYNSVRIMTGPLYLPKRDPKDGKFKVTYEMIGNPPNIAVPTHFFKLVVAERPKQLGNGRDDELHVAAFVLPNAPISNSTTLIEFEVPVNALERSSGLQLLQNVPKEKKKELCKQVRCEITVREFNNTVLALPGK